MPQLTTYANQTVQSRFNNEQFNKESFDLNLLGQPKTLKIAASPKFSAIHARTGFDRKTASLAIERYPINQYAIWTGQEVDCLMRAAANGRWIDDERQSKKRKGKHWSFQKDKYVWEVSGGTHRIEINMHVSHDASLSREELFELIKRQNRDFSLAFSYILSALSKQSGGIQNRLEGWIELNDVLRNIGWLKPTLSKKEKEDLRSRLWDFIRFASRASAVGERSSVYREGVSNNEIKTEINSEPWQIIIPEKFNSDNDKSIPLFVYIRVSPPWQPLVEERNLIQCFPGGELLARTLPKRITGDWAKTIGLALIRQWRLCADKSLENWRPLTRRQLLTRYAPIDNDAEQILKGHNSNRAVDYYVKALDLLKEVKLIANSGDAAMTKKDFESMKNGRREGWQDEWLDGIAEFDMGDELLKLVGAWASGRRFRGINAYLLAHPRR